MTKLKIYIFRHGETFFNQKGIFTGWKDSKLTPKGIKQAKIVAKKLKNKKFQVAFYTKLSRSKDTLKEVLKFHPECKKLILDNRIIERKYGKLQGLSHKKFIDKIGKRKLNLMKEGDSIENLNKASLKKLQKFLGTIEYNLIHRGYKIPPPKGESFEMVEKRVDDFIKDLKKLMKKEKINVAISAHGNSIRLFRKIMEKVPNKIITRWSIPYDKYFEYTLNI